jgi:hypothetical protein
MSWLMTPLFPNLLLNENEFYASQHSVLTHYLNCLSMNLLTL